MVAKSPRIGVGPGFDSQGSVPLFHKYCFPNLYWIHWSITKWSDLANTPTSSLYFEIGDHSLESWSLDRWWWWWMLVQTSKCRPSATSSLWSMWGRSMSPIERPLRQLLKPEPSALRQSWPVWSRLSCFSIVHWEAFVCIGYPKAEKEICRALRLKDCQANRYHHTQ